MLAVNFMSLSSLVSALPISKYCTRERFTLSRPLTYLKYKPHNIKVMPPNFKEMLTVQEM